MASAGKGTWKALEQVPFSGTCYEVWDSGLSPLVPNYCLAGEMEKMRQVQKWLAASCQGRYSENWFLGTYLFETFDDAVAFQLRFKGRIVTKNLDHDEADPRS